MKVKPGVWIAVAQLLTVINVGSVYFAASGSQPWHATLHATLAVGFTVWADWLRARVRGA